MEKKEYFIKTSI